MRVYELPPGQLGRAEGLFAGAWFDEAVIRAAFERRQPSRLFVDDPTQPSAALLARTYDFYLAGDPQPALGRFVTDAPAEAGVFAEWYGYCPLNEAWHEALLSGSSNRLEVIPRRSFKYRHAAPPAAKESRQRGGQVRPVDRALAERIDRDFAQSISRCWDGPAEFLRHGFGFCLLVGSRIASIAVPAAVSAHYADLDVETAPQFRRQGLAYRVCAAFIGECLARGLLACWDCDGPNLASAALAEELGFTEEKAFTELARPDRRPLDLSHGRWTAQPAGNGCTVWAAR